MLVRPADSAAALRILAGPAVGLGLADLAALAARANNLRGAAQEEAATGEDPATRLAAQLEALQARAAALHAGAEAPAGLADAVADLGEPERYSEEGLRRLRELAAKLRYLRTQSLGKRLVDLFTDIMDVFGIRTEVLARSLSLIHI